MKDALHKYWLQVTGGLSSISMKGISDAVNNTIVIDFSELFQYFLIGVVGTLAGLIVRILWGVIKRKFPTLNGIDK